MQMALRLLIKITFEMDFCPSSNDIDIAINDIQTNNKDTSASITSISMIQQQNQPADRPANQKICGKTIDLPAFWQRAKITDPFNQFSASKTRTKQLNFVDNVPLKSCQSGQQPDILYNSAHFECN